MIRQLTFAVGLLLSANAVMASGQGLHDSACLQCHAVLMDGESNAIYTRADKKISDLSGLKQRVSGCAEATGAAWTAQQRKEVVNYLAARFYRF